MVIAEVKIMVEQKRIKDGFILIYLDCVGRIQFAILIFILIFILIKSNQFRQVQLGWGFRGILIASDETYDFDCVILYMMAIYTKERFVYEQAN